MKIKLTFLSFFCLYFSMSAIAQDYKANIKKRFLDFNDLVIAGEYRKSMDYVPDAFFKVFPKEQLIAASEQLLNNKQLEYKILDIKVTEVQDKKKIDTNYYSLIKYSTIVIIKFLISEPEIPEVKLKRLDLTKTALGKTFGVENVKLNDKTEVFTLTPIKKSYAISKNGITNWKFVNVEANYKELLKTTLPEEVLQDF